MHCQKMLQRKVPMPHRRATLRSLATKLLALTSYTAHLFQWQPLDRKHLTFWSVGLVREGLDNRFPTLC